MAVGMALLLALAHRPGDGRVRGDEPAKPLDLRLVYDGRLKIQNGRNVLSPDGATRLIASGTTARLWKADLSEPAGAPLEHSDTVYAGAFSPDGKVVVTSTGRTIRLWDREKGRALKRFVVEPGEMDWGVDSLCLSPDGKLLAAGLGSRNGDEGEVQVWDISRDHLFKFTDRGSETRMGPALCVAFSPDGKVLRVRHHGLGGK